MRWLIVVLGLVGGAATGRLGLRWLEESARYRVLEHDAALPDITAHVLIGAMGIALVGVVLAWLRRGRTGGAVMLVAGLTPGLFDARAFVITWVLILAGMLAYEFSGRVDPSRRGSAGRTDRR